MSRGFSFESLSQPKPSLSITPGVKASMNTSALRTSRISTSRPPSVRRSRAKPRLLRFIDGTQAPPKCGRKCSPCSGSTLITSAPMSPKIWPAVGPAMTCVRSRTRVSVSGSMFGANTVL